MTTYLIYDLAIGIILLVFSLRGRSKGLVLALCSLAAIITAFLGANYAADVLTPRAAELVAPKIESIIERHLENSDLSGADSTQDNDAVPVGGNISAENSGADNQQASATDKVSGEEQSLSDAGIAAVKNAISELNLPVGLLNAVEKTLENMESIGSLPSTISSAIAQATANIILHLVIFIVAFVLILLFWSILGHALDLVARLPVLHFLNKTGGFAFGLCKGVCLLFVLAFVLRYLDNIIPEDAIEHTYLLRFFMTADPLAYLTGM